MTWRYFSEDEMRCRCGCGRIHMNEHFMQRLDDLRERVRFEMPVTSGYRCAEHNRNVGGAKMSAHLTGHAADLLVHGSQVWHLLAAAIDLGFLGIGLRQKGQRDKRFIHLDDVTSSPGRPRPWVWTY